MGILLFPIGFSKTRPGSLKSRPSPGKTDRDFVFPDRFLKDPTGFFEIPTVSWKNRLGFCFSRSVSQKPDRVF
jgi:hypothetical protein